ncbi:MAG: PKD domain-containing protein [Alcanivoracaceae bacterium]|nr:PKD domain-containing protein [Alcanivoracaceae bacterium]
MHSRLALLGLIALVFNAFATTGLARDLDIDNDGLIEIYSLDDLNEMRNNLDGSALFGSSEGCDSGCVGFELMKNLNFDTNGNGIFDAGDAFYNDGNGWTPIGDVSAPFTAGLVGNGFEIQHLNVHNTATSLTGFFGVIDGAGINDIGFTDANITTSNTAGVIADQARNSGMYRVYVSGSVAAVSGAEIVYLGGMLSSAYDTQITESFSEAQLIADNVSYAAIGGIAAHYSDGSVDDAFVRGSILYSGDGVEASIGGLFAFSIDVFPTKIYVATEFSINPSGGATVNVGSFQADQTTLYAQYSYWDAEKTGSNAPTAGALSLTTAEITCPTYSYDTACKSGEIIFENWIVDPWYFGTSDDYPHFLWYLDVDRDGDRLIEIDSLADLDAMRNDLNGTSLNGSSIGCEDCYGYELITDLDFDTNGNGIFDSGDQYWNAGEGWQPIGDDPDMFRANFDGNYHRISNLNINRPSDTDVGLFGVVGLAPSYEPSISNIMLDGTHTHVHGYENVGVLAGSFNSVFYSNLMVVLSGKVQGDIAVGGLIGRAYYSNFAYSYSGATVKAGNVGGGLVGLMDSNSSFYESYAGGNVYVELNGAGGLVGEIENCYFRSSYYRGRVAGGDSLGGVVGSTYNCDAAMDIYWDTTSSHVSTDPIGLGLTTQQLQCPTAANDSTCVAGITLYEFFDPSVWDFGTKEQYPALLFNGIPLRGFDVDNDGVVDEEDAFPNDIAASVDNDGDGKPDDWNASCDATCQANSDLVLDNKNPIANAGGPYTVSSGESVTLDASASTDEDGVITSYEWDLDNNGIFETSGINVIFTPDYAATEANVATIRLRVTDDAGDFHDSTTTLTTHYFPEPTVDDNDVERDEESGGSISFWLFGAFIGLLLRRQRALLNSRHN